MPFSLSVSMPAYTVRVRAFFLCFLLLAALPTWAVGQESEGEDAAPNEGLLSQEVLSSAALAALAGTWQPESSDPRCMLLPDAVQQMRCEDAYWIFFSMLEENKHLMLDLDDCFIKTVTTSLRCLEHPNRFEWGWQDGCRYAELSMRDHCIERYSTPVQAGPVQVETPGDRSER